MLALQYPPWALPPTVRGPRVNPEPSAERGDPRVEALLVALGALLERHLEQLHALFPAHVPHLAGDWDELVIGGVADDSNRVQPLLDALDLLAPEVVHQHKAAIGRRQSPLVPVGKMVALFR